MTESSPSRPALRFLSRLQRLEALPRTGWLVSGVTSPESIAAHAYEVTLLALWIAESVDEDVDTEQVLRIALLHDVSEALTTDIPTPTKRLIGRDVVHAAEQRAAAIVLEDAPPGWLDCVAEYDAGTSLEARIVKAADTVQMLARALAYRRAGRGDLERFFRPRRADYGIPFVRALLDEVERMHREDDWFAADLD